MRTTAHHRVATPLILWLSYVAFVIYGSLVPLQYKPRSMDSAIAAFKSIPFLKLGIESRADWISNGVLYVPVGILTVLALRAVWPRIATMLALPLAMAFCTALAVGVEFTQLFFPARTVSQNDLMAELIGSVIGLVLVTRFSSWFASVFSSLVQDSQRLFHLALDAYGVAYLAFALFPFDFLLSADEIANKANSNLWGWLLAGSDHRISIVMLRLMAEITLTLPLGWWLARAVRERAARRRAHRQLHRRGPESVSSSLNPNHASHSHSHSPLARYGLAVASGLALGFVLEITQFFIASGTSQGLSVLTRLFGVVAGTVLSHYAVSWKLEYAARLIRRFGWLLLLPYLLALLEVNGWLSTRWQGFDYAAEQWGKVNFMPFYYHYFTTEAMALFSLSAVTVSYVPLGVMAGAACRHAKEAALVALLFAGVVEAGKLFIKGSHPDPTNLLIAALTAWATVSFLRLAVSAGTSKPHDLTSISEVPATSSPTAPTVQLPIKRPSTAAWIGLVLCLAVAMFWWLNFPALQLLIAIVMVVSCGVVWLRPIFVFAVIPAALPVFDLAPWSGRFFVDEFDALLLAGLAISFFRAPALPVGWVRIPSLTWFVPVMVIISFGVSAVVGVMPLALPDDNSFNNYFSHFNSLRIVKGGVWALMVYGLSRRFAAVGIDARRPLAWGMAIGLGLSVAFIAWERIAFSGLWNYASSYRVTGPFSAIHVGGAYIECFLAAATPFLLILMVENRQWTVRLAGFFVLLGTTYALMVTFSRNGYSAFAVSVAVVLTFAVTRSKHLVRSGVIAAGVVATLLVVAVPIFKGEFAQARMDTIRADLAVRYAHWNDALSIRDASLSSSLFGMGLGTYPETNYWRSTEYPRTGTYRLEIEAGNRYLRLGSGDSIYMEQLVSVKPGQQYVLKLSARANRPDAKITVPICEKWLLTSYNCVWQTVELGKKVGEWQSIERRFTAKDFTVSPWYAQRPIKLALYNPGPSSLIDVDDVHLETANGVNVVRNGGFSQQLDHWFVVTDSHLQWHTKSMFYGLLFDQGWLGLVAVGVMLAMALTNGVKSALKGDAYAAAAVAALSSFLVVAVFDTLIDSPRFLLLLLMLTWACYSPKLQGTQGKFKLASKKSKRQTL